VRQFTLKLTARLHFVEVGSSLRKTGVTVRLQAVVPIIIRRRSAGIKEPHPAGKLLSPWRSQSLHRQARRYYNHQRCHESLKNLTPADVYFGRGQTILLKRERIKRDTIQNRRLQHQKKAA